MNLSRQITQNWKLNYKVCKYGLSMYARISKNKEQSNTYIPTYVSKDSLTYNVCKLGKDLITPLTTTQLSDNFIAIIDKNIILFCWEFKLFIKQWIDLIFLH